MYQVMSKWRIGVVALAFAALPAAAQTVTQKTGRQAAAALADGKLTPERDRALALARSLGSQASSEFKLAVIEAAWAELRGETGRPEGSEAVFDYMDAVARLRDPRAIPFLIEVLSNGSGASNALADFGPAVAFAPVLAVVSDPNEFAYQVSGGLTTLRFMLGDGFLTAEQTDQARTVVRERLSRSQQATIVRVAVRLALALKDPELRTLVERFADDKEFAESLVSRYLPSGNPMSDEGHAQTVTAIQKRTRIFLDGGGADIGPFRRKSAATAH